MSSAFRRRSRPSTVLGLAVVVGCLVVSTAFGALLQRLTTIPSPGALYLICVVLVTAVWGLGLGSVMAVTGVLTYDFVLILPRWGFDSFGRHELLLLAIYLATALLVSVLSTLVWGLSVEVEARQEADLSADLARLLLRAPEPDMALPAAAEELGRRLGLSSASIRPGSVDHDGHGAVFPLHGHGVDATLVLPAHPGEETSRRLRERVVPGLEVLLEAAYARDEVAGALRSSRDELARVVDEQAALRRLATLVAHSAPPTEVFAAVAREAGRVLGVLHTVVARYERDGTAVRVGTWNLKAEFNDILPVAERWAPEAGTVTDIVWRTSAPGRVDLYDGNGRLSTLLRERGVIGTVGCPIIVGRSLWGLVLASADRTHPLPPDTEKRMTEFTELAAAAIANAQSDADLRASRARVVAAADDARRRIERDLHDGTQQQLVAIGLELRGTAAGVPEAEDDLRRRLMGTAKAVDEAVMDLQELSRGLHPAALAKGGLESGLIVLTRRCALPVTLEVDLPCRPAEPVELTAYYVVSEALTNTAKHASASAVHVRLDVGEGRLRVCVRDDGAGGADPTRGSGLVGLTDRVEAVGGTLSVVSPAGGGTSLLAELPFTAAD